MEHAKRVRILRASYQRELRRKPNVAEASAMWRAANLTALAESVLANPQSTAADVCRLDTAAATARSAMFAIFKQGDRPPDHDYLDEMIA